MIIFNKNAKIVPRGTFMQVPSYKIEEELIGAGKNIILGMDEAGRGPLAGPLVCAGVIIKNPKALNIDIIRDSKTLSEKQRETSFKLISENSDKISYSFVDNKYIDENGISKALEKGYQDILESIETFDHILLDGNQSYVKEKNISVIVKGDAHSKTIAAASIVAKYLRDKYMIQSSKIFPEYEFHVHKGYGTSKHFDNIKTHGMCKLHRKTFLKTMN